MVFDVVEQRLGIEGCVIAQEGSYEVGRGPGGSDVILTTQYRTFLHPRWLWRPLERMVARSLHLHNLRAVENSNREEALPTASQTMPGQNPPAGPLAPLRGTEEQGDAAGPKEPTVPAGRA